MAKPPPDIPTGECGERVTLRANSARQGAVIHFGPRLWVEVEWDDGKRAPKICHQYELKRLPIDASAKTCV